MAILIPDIQKIEKLSVKATDGEIHLLKTLSKKLDDSYEVYFNPYLNGDRPDVVVFHPKRGVLIIEVKDWNIDLYCLDEKKHWKLKMPKNQKEANTIIKSPISQALKYKDNLYELHIEKLLELKIKDVRHFNFVSCAIYFHNGSSKQISDLLVLPYKNDKKYMNFLKYNIDFFSNELLDQDIELCLKKRWLNRDSKNNLFTKDISNNIKRFLSPTCHTKKDGEKFSYDKKQLELIYSDDKEMRIKGVVGSGKTTIMAHRAALAAKKGNKVLILSYNITLKNYIHDKIQHVPLDFDWRNITINNYHEFINSQLNNLGISISIPEGENRNNMSIYLENNYYGNKYLFEDHKDEIEKYDAIFIDEIQDYHRSWMDIIKVYFWNSNGQYILFGDVKQNIYNNFTDNKDIHANVRSVRELKQCYRSQFKVKNLQ
jgi:Superfamily I DNA and RNA helicases